MPNPINHYKTLGVSLSATQKEIKAAFYELSKKFHPDTNKDGEKRSEMFQNIVNAYEVLGSPEKKRIYDMTINHGRPPITLSRERQKAETSSKLYTDLDIEYKDFEHFQRNNRRRRVYNSEYEVPEYLRHLGLSRQEGVKSGEEKQYTFKDSRAYEREEKEQRLAREMEEARLKAKFPVPTFEQLIRQKEKLSKDRSYANFKSGLIILALVSGISTVLFGGMHIPR